MRTLITGGSGFIGTNLVSRFVARGDSVLNLDIAPPRNTAHREFHRAIDLRDREGLSRTVRQFSPEVVLHMGARTDLEGHSLAEYTANTDGVRNLIVALDGIEDLRRVIVASSRLVCRIGYQPVGDEDYCPTTVYGQSKVLGERIVRELGSQIAATWTIVRPTSIWGPWFDIPYKTFFLAIARGRYIHPCGTTIRKSFGYVGNTVYEIERLLEANATDVGGRTLYLADYPPIDVADMAEKIRAASFAPRIRSVNRTLLKIAARIGDGLKVLGFRDPPLTTFRLDNLMTNMIHDLGPLRQIAGDLPISLEDGIRETVEWLRARGEVK